MTMHVFSKTIMQYCVIEVREHPDFFLILIESTCVAIKKRNKFMSCNGKNVISQRYNVGKNAKTKPTRSEKMLK